MRNTQIQTVTILNTESLSDATDTLGYELAAVAFPSAWTAADLTLQTSDDGVTYRNVFSGTTELTIDAAASQWTVVSPDASHGLGRYLKVRSGPASAPVAQLADRSIKLVLTEKF